MASPRSFDISEPQVLAQVGGELQWTHLVLLRRLEGTGARWLVLKPNGLIESLDFTSIPLLTLLRATELPEGTIDDVVLFPAELTDEDMVSHHRRAAAMSRLVGPSVPTADPARPGQSWRICHSGCEFFGDAVPDDVVSNTNSGAVRGSTGLALHEGNWWPVELVPDNEYASWMSYMRNGPGRDPRIAGAVRDGSGRRYVPLRDYLGMLRPMDRSKEKDYPHKGPPVVLEL